MPQYEIEIDHKPLIFDDPKWCAGPTEIGHRDCRFLVYNEDCCFYSFDEDEFVGLSQKENQFEELTAIKCDECKEAYQKAKSIQLEKDNSKDKNEH